mgnify:CR=1 FL=1
MAHEELPPINITPGAIRFNTDSMKLEYFRIGMEGGSTSSYAGIGTMAAGEWVQITTDTPDIHTGGTRGIFAGGGPSAVDTINYINVDTTGNALDFGDLLNDSKEGCGLASRTRGVFVLGQSPANSDTIEMLTIASTGSVEDFGNLHTGNARVTDACSNQTRGLFAGQEDPSRTNVIRYISIAEKGDTLDFGDLIANKGFGAGCSSSTRGVFAGGRDPGGTSLKPIEFVTISTLGNAADFGDLTAITVALSGGSNSIRGIFGGGATPGYSNKIDYITIATLGDALDFGDLTEPRNPRATSSSTRVAFGAGYDPSPGAVTNIIDYIQIMSLGDAVDFGDLLYSIQNGSACSNGHGGLG